MNKGKVYLVGAGPGDKQLITVKGLQCIQKADVILYDRLVNPLLLEEAPVGVELIYCGKLPKQHIVRQEKINELLVTKSKQGKTVVRLKGGDPSVFGRVGEEAEVLAQNEIEFEIVPGITSGIAASSYAGIPVTHRDYATSFAVVTGHDKSKDGKPHIDWKSLANGIDTIAFYMGIGNLDYITSQLIRHGKSKQTPVILIQWGTYGHQQTLEGTLQTISQKAEEESFQNPAITLVGSVVSLREKLKWFEKKTLYGKSIVLARTTAGEGEVAQKLTNLGADVFQFPRFESQSLLFDKSTKRKFQKVTHYKQILFTCPKSVDLFFEALSLYGMDIRSIQGTFFAKSIKTENALKKYGCTSQPDSELSFSSNLLMIGGKTSDRAPVPLNRRLDYLALHQTKFVEQSIETLRRLEAERMVNTVIFPSTKSVEVFMNTLQENKINSKEYFANKTIITFGGKSYQAAQVAGLKVDDCLSKPSIDELIKTLTSQKVLQ
ncbi:uroporphyrinogen-III C-methyltransferase [Anaerobacillus alkalilacustris]|uniref:Uroporphyrinogen-III C-methyltransferase n=1 Tax=Anaerobacillus alkalilacustris TaxID=393763 RepID=A0A1S2LM40_9BACI|nr:uroporphyrinogen-III C-methyltransferase [Anaerobacillus alkalilacustris]OIJ13589.1 uroporphyrinogen-III C-methyltransferase [Anaerobacillus alkalilacustris]